MRTFFKYVARLLGALVAVLLAAVLFNGSFWTDYKAPLTLLAHRGLAQTYHRDGLTNETCTASRIHNPEHPYLENTIVSMQAAFAAGADIVEFDIHPTTDGQFAVVHDWRLECRTNGTGVTREHTLAELKTLDVGHGYTADGGKTFPFRGCGVGLMPSLDDVLAAFPDRRFLINIKSNDPREGELLAERLLQLPAEQRARLMAYGGDRPIATLRGRLPAMLTTSRKALVACGTRYIAIGWSGVVPDACRGTIVLVPVNMGWLLWGWPNLFLERMHAAGSEVFVAGPYGAGDVGSSGIDTAEDMDRLPGGFSGGIWTNRIDRVGKRFGRSGEPTSSP